MPALELDSLLESSGLVTHPAEAEDCSIVKVSDTKALLTNIDILTPIHDDPYIMGKIAACNATNDLFALNAVDVLDYNCFLALPPDMPKDVAVNILKGMRDFLKEIDAKIGGGHTVQNKVPLMGGSTSSLVDYDSIIYKQGCKTGDRLILTKPMGIQSIMAGDRVLNSNPEWLEDYNISNIRTGVKMAEKMMTTSNRKIPLVIQDNSQTFNNQTIHAMTDVTGFGFKRHLEEMLIETGLGADVFSLPIIISSGDLGDLFCYPIAEGGGKETAGAMLISLDPSIFQDFTQALTNENVWWFEIGTITNAHTSVRFTKDFHVVEINKF